MSGFLHHDPDSRDQAVKELEALQDELGRLRTEVWKAQSAEPVHEFFLTGEKLKQGESIRLAASDRVVDAHWDEWQKWCYLTILRRAES